MALFKRQPKTPAPAGASPTETAARGADLSDKINAYLAGRGLAVPPVRAVFSDEVTTDFELVLRRENGAITCLTSTRKRGPSIGMPMSKGPTYIYWFANADTAVDDISCDLSDGEWPGLARFTFSTCFHDRVLVPDMHFFRDHGYRDVDAVAATAPAWDDRDEPIFWRGMYNNLGLFSTDPEHADNPLVMQRLRLALKARDIPGLDVRFVAGSTPDQDGACAAAGLLAPRRPWQAWAGDKYAIDIDGYTNAWSNLQQRLRLGCCVLKVESQHGFRQWYYDDLKPYEHYVPVKADMSDLATQIDWVRSHDSEARAIAANGQALALAMTFERETKRAARILEDACA